MENLVNTTCIFIKFCSADNVFFLHKYCGTANLSRYIIGSLPTAKVDIKEAASYPRNDGGWPGYPRVPPESSCLPRMISWKDATGSKLDILWETGPAQGLELPFGNWPHGYWERLLVVRWLLWKQWRLFPVQVTSCNKWNQRIQRLKNIQPLVSGGISGAMARICQDSWVLILSHTAWFSAQFLGRHPDPKTNPRHSTTGSGPLHAPTGCFTGE